jgi:hypothetical protein
MRTPIAHRLQSPDNLQQSSAEDVITPKRVAIANGRQAHLGVARGHGFGIDLGHVPFVEGDAAIALERRPRGSPEQEQR